MKKLTTALFVQWICFLASIGALLLAVAISRINDLLASVLLTAAFVIAVIWTIFVAVYGRKLSWSYKFPIALLLATIVKAVIGPHYYVHPMPSAQHMAKRQISQFGTALDSLKQDIGRYPSTEEGLQALRMKPEGITGWDGPYLLKDLPNDPWGHPFIYRFPGKNPRQPEIISYGADGKPGGEGQNADIFNDEVPLHKEY
jgi:general secretion pathway protein G